MASKKLDLSQGAHVTFSRLFNPGSSDKTVGLRIEVYPLPDDETLLRTLAGVCSQTINKTLSDLSGESLATLRMPSETQQ